MEGMIRVTVRIFGPAADVVGQNALDYALTAPATLGDLLELLRAKHRGLERTWGSLRWAINEEYAEASQTLGDGDEVALIPPVSGGQSASVVLSAEPIDVPAMAACADASGCGGIVTFVGIVRAEGSPDNPLVALDYSAYDSMALKQMVALRGEALNRFAVREVVIAHRTGRLAIGEASVAVVVAAPHRAEAFDACRWVIDTLKRDVPIWKKEVWLRGEATWVES